MVTRMLAYLRDLRISTTALCDACISNLGRPASLWRFILFKR